MIFLDAQAVIRHAYHIGEDPDAILTELGNDVSTAAYGFNKFMERYGLPMFESDAPIDVLVAHDSGVEFRKKIFPEYKMSKSRIDRDPEERKQVKLLTEMVKRFLAAMGCTQAQVAGVEADDLLAYFCETIPGNHDLYTVDADLLQLQGQHDNVQVLLKCEYQDTGEHKGIPHKHISFSKSLLGDNSDNYKGIDGFGPAKWNHLVKEYGYDGIEELNACVETKDYTMLIDAIKETGDKVLMLMYQNRDDWRKSWVLAKLHPELCWKPVPAKKLITKIDWYKRVINAAEVAKIFNLMGCGDLIDHPSISQWLNTQWMLTPEEVDEDLFTEFAAECKKSPVVAFDYETHPSDLAMLTNPKGQDFVDVKEALIAGTSFTFGENLNTTIYIPVNHKDTDNIDKGVIARLLQIAEDNSTLVVQNASFELAVTRTNLDFWLKPLYDTRITQSYVDENEESGLKAMSKKLLNYNQTSYRDTVWDEAEQRMRTMDELTGEEVTQYGCDDAIVTGHIFILHRIILWIEGTFDFVTEYETCSQHSLVDAYLKGAEIDWEALEVQRKVDEETIRKNYIRLRELLEENCSTPDAGAAKEFTRHNKAYLKAVAKKKAKDAFNNPKEYTKEQVNVINEAVAESVNSFQVKALKGSMYTEHTTHIEQLEFKPTVAQFNEVLGHLEFEEMLPTASQKAISSWLVEVTNIDFDAPEGASTLTPKQEEFCDLMGKGMAGIPKRDGEDYKKLIAFCAANRSKVGKEISEGDELNTGSPIQMQHLLYCKMGFPVRLTNMVARGTGRDLLGIREGSPQTDGLALKTAMAEDTAEGDWRREAIDCTLKIKEAKTQISLYHDAYPLWKHASDGRIHPQIRSCSTVTRRPIGTSPNLLQVSKSKGDGVMRSIFIPRSKDEVIVSIDFAQQEIVVLASMSKDENLLACYSGENKKDVHSMTASGIAGVSYSEYLDAYNDNTHVNHTKFVKIRKKEAKQVNFLRNYMGTAITLSQNLIVPYEVAEEMMKSADETYPGVTLWQQSVIKFAKEHGYSKTAYGNRRHINSDIFSSDNSIQKRMSRQAVNSEIQGTGADILKIVLTDCWKTNLWGDTKATLLAPVYDELVSSVPKVSVVDYIDRLVEIMEIKPPNHQLKMVADVSLGATWRDQLEIGVHPSEKTILDTVGESEK